MEKRRYLQGTFTFIVCFDSSPVLILWVERTVPVGGAGVEGIMSPKYDGHPHPVPHMLLFPFSFLVLLLFTIVLDSEVEMD